MGALPAIYAFELGGKGLEGPCARGPQILRTAVTVPGVPQGPGDARSVPCHAEGSSGSLAKGSEGWHMGQR